MRTLTTLTAITILILAAGLATAETVRQDYDQQAVYSPRTHIPELQGLTTLTVSPQYLEIYRINEASVALEGQLLTQLAAAQDDDVVQQLVYRLERIQTDRDLNILKVRVRYARLEGRYDLAFQLRQEMLELIQKDISPPM